MGNVDETNQQQISYFQDDQSQENIISIQGASSHLMRLIDDNIDKI